MTQTNYSECKFDIASTFTHTFWVIMCVAILSSTFVFATRISGFLIGVMDGYVEHYKPHIVFGLIQATENLKKQYFGEKNNDKDGNSNGDSDGDSDSGSDAESNDGDNVTYGSGKTFGEDQELPESKELELVNVHESTTKTSEFLEKTEDKKNTNEDN